MKMSDGSIVITTELDTDVFISALENLGNLARNAVGDVINVFSEMSGNVAVALLTGKVSLTDAALIWLDGILVSVQSMRDSVASAIEQMIVHAVGAVGESTESMAMAAASFFQSLGDTAQMMKEISLTAVGALVTETISHILGRVSEMSKAAASFFQGLSTSAAQNAASSTATLKNCIMSLLNTVSGSAGSMLSAASAFFHGLVAAASGSTQSVLSAVGSIISQAVAKVQSGYSAMYSAGQTLASGIWAGISSMASYLYGQISSLIGGLLSYARNIIGSHSIINGKGITSYLNHTLQNSGLTVPGGFFSGGSNSLKNLSNINLGTGTVKGFERNSGNMGVTSVNHYHTTYQFAAAGGTISEQLRTARAQEQIRRLRGGF